MDGVIHVTVSGELDIHTAPQLYDVLTEASADGDRLVLDLSDVRFIDSTGIRVLIVTWQESQRDGFSFQLTRGTDPVMRAFELCGLLDELPFLGGSSV
jgi:anti-anti-sigma factor